jgi:hypothetical protein
MDLLCGYGSDSGSDTSGADDAKTEETPKASSSSKLSMVDAPNKIVPSSSSKRKVQTILPSADELFDAVDSSNFLYAKPVEVFDIKPMKKAGLNEAEVVVNQSVKKPNANNNSILLPPQLTHGANKSTEDVSRWSTTSSGKAAAATQDKKKKDISFSEKEKRKRQQGKTSREGSFVEEEKRLLRQAGE